MKQTATMLRSMRVCMGVAVLSLLVALAFAIPSAHAATVTGMDYYGTVAANQPIDVLSIAGSEDEKLYVDIYEGDVLVAKQYEWTLHQSGGAKAGVLQLNTPLLSASGIDTYKIEVFSDQNETQSVGTWYLKAITATLKDTGEQVVIGVRSYNSSEDARVYHYASAVEIDGKSYQRVAVGDGTYVYQAYDPTTAITGTITYVDEQGNVIPYTGGNVVDGVQSVEGITSVYTDADPLVVNLQTIFNVQDNSGKTIIYRALSNTGTVSMSYPGKTEYTIQCRKIASADSSTGFYEARVQYYCGTKLLFTDKITINQLHYYTLPSAFFMRADGVVTQYTLSSSNNVITMDPLDADDVQAGVKTFKVYYDAAVPTDPVTWTVRKVNGVTGETFDTVTFEGINSGETKTFTPEDETLSDGTKLVPFNPDAVSFTYGDVNVTTVYYVPEGYVPDEAYNVTLRYVNIADNSVIDSTTVAIDPANNKDTAVGPGPVQFDKNGVTWVRLDGQGAAFAHNYFNKSRTTYTVYYRDIDDTQYAGTVITYIIPPDIEDEGVVDEGTTITDGGTTEVTEIVVLGEEGGLADSDGTTTQEERERAEGLIFDDSTPLGQMLNEGTRTGVLPVACGIVAVAIVALIIALLLFKRRKKNDDADGNSNAAA